MSPHRPGLSALRVDDQARIVRVFDAEDVSRWCVLAGVQANVAQVPEPLIAGLFSCLLGERLPSYGTNYLKQRMHFEYAAPIGAPLTATVTITAIRTDKALVDLATQCADPDDRIICTGHALVLFDR